GAARRGPRAAVMVLRALLAFVLAFGAGAAVYPMVIGWLARAGVGQPIREEGPPSHQSRSGTPTAGGIVFLALGLILYLVFDRSRAGGLVLLALLGGGGRGRARRGPSGRLEPSRREGRAGGRVGAIAFATLTLSALRSQHAAAAWLPAILTGLLLAFLVYNLSPARVFMGDTGSLALGNALV